MVKSKIIHYITDKTQYMYNLQMHFGAFLASLSINISNYTNYNNHVKLKIKINIRDLRHITIKGTMKKNLE